MNEGREGRRVVEIADLDVPVVSLGTDADGEPLALAFGGHVLRLVNADEGLSNPRQIVLGSSRRRRTTHEAYDAHLDSAELACSR